MYEICKQNIGGCTQMVGCNIPAPKKNFSSANDYDDTNYKKNWYTRRKYIYIYLNIQKTQNIPIFSIKSVE